MLYIESHVELRNHPKLLRLEGLLGVCKAQVIGHLHMLWWWALSYAVDGKLSNYDAKEIAIACGWTGDAQQLVDSLMKSQWLDTGMRIHDWKSYGGKVLESRKRAAARQAMHRKKKALQSQSRNGDVGVTSRARVEQSRAYKEIQRNGEQNRDVVIITPQIADAVTQGMREAAGIRTQPQ